MSTLCAGCGHDSVTAAIVRAFWELDIAAAHDRQAVAASAARRRRRPTSSAGAHGFNSAHGRMPAIATGANAANRELTYIGISGDGDSLSIGLGQLCHAIRRNVNMLYVIENNGVYGLTKGQFSASADVGIEEQAGRGQPAGAHRSGDAGAEPGRDLRGAQLLGRQGSSWCRILKAGLAHRGFALVDVISPCVTFNDHEGSTKSYRLHAQAHAAR